MKRSLLTVTAGLLVAMVTMSQTPPTQPALVDPVTPQGRYVGVASCVNSGCHGSTLPLNTTRVLQNEYFTWLNGGAHSRSYNVLFDAKSARILRNLHLSGNAWLEPRCLACHTTNVRASEVSGAIDREDGVQCETCHGPASGWRDEHTQPGWRHEQSVQLGMTDLHRVATRGTLCMSCHVGDATRQVDHELIASGHPLLAFELDNYTAAMPAHWKPNETHGARAWAVGQVVALRTSLANVASHARGEAWPEFSDMSCFNCHHSLKSSGWRQERGWSDRAGLPAWSGQRWIVTRLILDRAAPDLRSELEPLVNDVARRVSRMNDASGTAAAADRAASAITDAAIARIEAMSWRDEDIRSLMKDVTADGDAIARADVHSAEQIALTLQSLAAVLTRKDAGIARGSMMKAIDALFVEVRDRDDFDPRRFAAKVGEFRKTL
jgi:hypothetical protein